MTEDKKDEEMIHCEKLYLTKRKRVVKSTALNFTNLFWPCQQTS